MKGPQTTLINPDNKEEKDFAFDYSYWSHDGFETDDTGYNDAVAGSSKFAGAAESVHRVYTVGQGRPPGQRVPRTRGWEGRVRRRTGGCV